MFKKVDTFFYESLVGGHAPPRKLRKYREADERIRRIVGNFDNYNLNNNITVYLRGLAHNFEMNV